MKFQRRAFVLLISLALTAGNVLAQDAPANSSDNAPTGLTMLFLLVGIFALLGIGLFSGSSSSANDGSD